MDTDRHSRDGELETRPILGLGLLFDALTRTLDSEAVAFLARFDEHLEQEYRKLEDTPGDHEEAMRLLLEAHGWIVTQTKPGYDLRWAPDPPN